MQGAIYKVCRAIIEPNFVVYGNYQRAEPNITFLFSRPGFGKTTLALQLSSRIASMTGGNAVVFSMEWPGDRLLERCSSMGLDNIIVDDDPLFTVDGAIAKLEEIPDVRIVVVDSLQLINGNEDKGRLGDLDKRTGGAPVLVTSQLGRASEDNPSRLATLTDILSTLHRSGFSLLETKRFKKLCLNRPHGCYRNIGTAVDFDVSDETRIVEYGADGPTGEYELFWGPHSMMFSDTKPGCD